MNRTPPLRTASLLLAAAAVSLALATASCTPNEAASLGLGDAELYIPQKGGSTEITVDATGEWAATGMNKWLTVVPYKGTGRKRTTITADANSSIEPRSVTITFQCGTRTATLVCYQDGRTPTIILTAPEDPTIPAAGGSVTVRATTPVGTISVAKSAGWLEMEVDQDPEKYTFSAGPNNTGSARTATVTFSAEGLKSVSVTISQASL